MQNEILRRNLGRISASTPSGFPCFQATRHRDGIPSSSTTRGSRTIGTRTSGTQPRRKLAAITNSNPFPWPPSKDRPLGCLAKSSDDSKDGHNLVTVTPVWAQTGWHGSGRRMRFDLQQGHGSELNRMTRNEPDNPLKVETPDYVRRVHSCDQIPLICESWLTFRHLPCASL